MKRVAFLFPGQGSQYIGMGHKFYDKYDIFKNTLDEASDILGYNVPDKCFKGDIDDITRTEVAQPLILTIGVASFRLFMKTIGIEPSFCAGHSLGEYTALTCAGVIKFSDALQLVKTRGTLMNEIGHGVGIMAAVSGKISNSVEDLCKDISRTKGLVTISNYNTPNQVVISGENDSVKEACEILSKQGYGITILKVSGPFHSSLMEPVSKKFLNELNKYKYENFKWPVISNVNALPYEGTEFIHSTLAKHMTNPVRWNESINYIIKNGIDEFIDFGPKRIIGNLVKQIDERSFISSVDHNEDNDFFELIQRDKFLNIVTKCLAIAVCTKNNNWDNDEYQKGAVEPYKKVQQMYETLEKDGLKPTFDQAESAVGMLVSVFKTKKVPQDEQVDRFNRMFTDTNTKGLFEKFMSINYMNF